MLRIAVVDVSAEARSRIAREIGRLQDNASHELSLLPKLSIQQLAPEEIKFHGAPDLLIIGDELIGSDIGAVGRIRAILSDTPIVVRLRKDQETLLVIEDLARLGADDTISENIDPLSLSKKIILHCRRPKKGRTANLILVDSAKGGLGVTSLVAGLGEALVAAGKKVALVDLDSETQDLSRFLQARPFINENLEMLVDGVKPVAEEHVRQCLTPVWSDEDGLFCMSPSLIGEDSQGLTPVQTRNLLSVLEIVDSIFDVVIIDVGCARGTLLKTLYRVADRVVMLVNNDPASLYATVSRMSVVRQWINPTAEMVLVENASGVSGLPSEILRREINLATKSDDGRWFAKVIPNCRSAARWPGSGDTIFSRGKKSLVGILASLAHRMAEGEEIESEAQAERNWGIFETLRSKLNRSLPEFGRGASASSLQKAQKLLSFKPKEKNDATASLEKAEAAFEKLAQAKAKTSQASDKGDLNEVDQLIRRAI